MGGAPGESWPAPTSSFVDYVRASAPQLLPFGRSLPSGELPAAPHGTTIVALTFPGGVVMAGDRRATQGTLIANRHMEKVFLADARSVIGIAGSAGIALDLVRLFQVELEHYEKMEGTALSLEGKANRLGAMVRANLPQAMQGLAAVPVFAGVDPGTDHGRLFSYDVTGGRYEEHEHFSVGSGAAFARGALKKLWHPALDRATAVAVAVEALWDAADDDAATGGPDTLRRLWPIVYAVQADGAHPIEATVLGEVVASLLARRTGIAGEA